MNWANTKSSTKTSPVWIWQKKSRKCQQNWMSSCKKSTTCINKKASQLWPNHGCHRSKSGSRWMSWTRSCRSRLGKNGQLQASWSGSPISRKRKSKKQSLSICQKMGISSFTEVQVQERPLSSRQQLWIWLASRAQKIWLCICSISEPMV